MLLQFDFKDAIFIYPKICIPEPAFLGFPGWAKIGK
jgi:hypothetical protein